MARSLSTVERPSKFGVMRAAWAEAVTDELLNLRAENVRMRGAKREGEFLSGVVAACSVTAGVAAPANTITYDVQVYRSTLLFAAVTPLNRVVVPSAFPLVPAPIGSPCMIVSARDADGLRIFQVIVFGEQMALSAACPG